jgi:hypothetical protein
MVALSHPNPPAPPGPFAAQNPPPSSDRPHQAHSSADDIHGERLIDKLAILQGLVFDLRRGVEDLQFRLELNNEQIGLFLQLLSSLQATIHKDTEAATSMPETTVDTGGIRADKGKEYGSPSHSNADMKQSGEEQGKKSQNSETAPSLRHRTQREAISASTLLQRSKCNGAMEPQSLKRSQGPRTSRAPGQATWQPSRLCVFLLLLL